MTTGSFADVPVPPEWKRQQLWTIAPRMNEKGYPDADPLSVYLGLGVVPRSSREDNHNRLGADLGNYLRVQPGDIVFNKLRTWQGGLGVSTYNGIVSPAYFVCRPTSAVEPRFLHHLLHSRPYLAELTRLSKWMPPSQFDIGWDELRALPILLPPFMDQRRIADFLDDQVTRLNRGIELTRRQRGVLEEGQRAFVEASVVGLDQPGNRQQSPVGWIGSAPEDWSIQPIGRKFDIQLGKMLAPDRISGTHEHPYLRNTNVQWDRIDTSDLLIMNFPPTEQARYRVEPGDLLVCEGGDIGRAAIWDGSIDEIYYQKALHRVRSRSETSVRWLYYVLRAATRLGVFTAEGGLSTIAHLTGEQLRAHRVPIPPPDVERRLITELDERAATTSVLVDALAKRLALLDERKQALITAAVTGQFDVTAARAVA